MDFAAFERACLAMPKAKRAEWASGKRITDRISFRVDNAEFREFAAWMDEGVQPGVHLRYATASRLAEPGFERSKAFRGAKHNWYRITPAAKLDARALAALIDESYRASQERGGGLAISGAELYAPLARGLALAAVDSRPARLHASGPAAKIVGNEGPAAFKLALWSAHEISSLVPKAERAWLAHALARLDEVDALRDRLVATLADKQIRMGVGYDQLSKAAGSLPESAGDSQPIVAACAAGAAFRSLPGGYNERATGFAGDAICAAVRALVAHDRDVAGYLTELDRRILVAEVTAVAKARSLDLAKLDRVLWRGADAKGYPALWVVAFAGGDFGLVCKLGTRWKLVRGPRDEVVATIPDTHLAAAVDWITHDGVR